MCPDPRIRSQVANAGADGFFFKPVDIADFLDAVERSLGFVESFLPPELTLHVEDLDDPVEEDESSMGINQHIADLRVSLSATAVLLVTIDGKVLARAGDLPDPELEISLMPVLMRAFNAGVHISNFLGQNIPDHFYSYRGENYDLFLAPAGDSHCLLVLTKPTLPQEIGNIISLVQGTARSVFLNLARLKIIPAGRRISERFAIGRTGRRAGCAGNFSRRGRIRFQPGRTAGRRRTGTTPRRRRFLGCRCGGRH